MPFFFGVARKNVACEVRNRAVSRAMKPCLTFIAFLTAFLFACPESVLADKNSGGRRKFKQMSEDLKNSRESLHRAQRELASKSEQIAELEKRLKMSEEARRKSGDGSAEKMRHEIAALRKKNSELARGLAKLKEHVARSKAQAAGNEPSKSKGPKKKVEAITIRYDEDSAASYDGRERVLKWVEAQTKRGAKSFRIEGWANDSEYPEVNNEIANNRSRYLADYLVIRGIPRCSLTTKGAATDAEASKGRFVTVSASRK